MDVLIEINSEIDNDRVIIECSQVTPDIEEIKCFAMSKQKYITGRIDDQIHKLQPSDIFYFEVVDEKVFAYTKNAVYEVKSRLYELEKSFSGCGFLRCSKSVLLNIYLVESFSPALNGRFYAVMKNKEKLIVSRQYVSDFKKAILG
ncbi:MAG: LytTR family DNA-binding domain-containing protein [Oscillospiraceae bacterium]|nr:LytTR family DNA-binding domain-containing protein [Oscillospiraceae bacterium]